MTNQNIVKNSSIFMSKLHFQFIKECVLIQFLRVFLVSRSHTLPVNETSLHRQVHWAQQHTIDMNKLVYVQIYSFLI
jgi:hypothetical protein